MFEIPIPKTKDDLARALTALDAEISSYMRTFSTPSFLAAQGTAWSPEGHLRHLTKSIRPVAQAMRMPKLALRTLFGVSREGSRSFSAIRDLYLQKLAEGAQAGSYAPSSRKIEMSAEAWQKLVFERWEAAGQDLIEVLGKWSEAQLDRYRLPHPVLGKLTVREMLFFTLYHNRHHARRVQERVQERAETHHGAESS